jgi:hypothetical protein
MVLRRRLRPSYTNREDRFPQIRPREPVIHFLKGKGKDICSEKKVIVAS